MRQLIDAQAVLVVQLDVIMLLTYAEVRQVQLATDPPASSVDHVGARLELLERAQQRPVHGALIARRALGEEPRRRDPVTEDIVCLVPVAGFDQSVQEHLVVVDVVGPSRLGGLQHSHGDAELLNEEIDEAGIGMPFLDVAREEIVHHDVPVVVVPDVEGDVDGPLEHAADRLELGDERGDDPRDCIRDILLAAEDVRVTESNIWHDRDGLEDAQQVPVKVGSMHVGRRAERTQEVREGLQGCGSLLRL